MSLLQGGSLQSNHICIKIPCENPRPGLFFKFLVKKKEPQIKIYKENPHTGMFQLHNEVAAMTIGFILTKENYFSTDLFLNLAPLFAYTQDRKFSIYYPCLADKLATEAKILKGI